MAKQQADQFEWGDWLNDVELQSASAATRGIWMNLLCRMWFSKEQGRITIKATEMSRFCNANVQEIAAFVTEIVTLKFGDAKRETDGSVTFICRRMFRRWRQREMARKRVKKHRMKRSGKRPCNANVTFASSSLQEEESVTPLKRPGGEGGVVPDGSAASPTVQEPESQRDPEVQAKAKKIIGGFLGKPGRQEKAQT